MEIKIKKQITKYESMQIHCPCGMTVGVDYDDSTKTKETWCTHCNRYYVRDEKDLTIFHQKGFRCFKCNKQVTELFKGPRFVDDENVREEHFLCEKCIKEKITLYKNRVILNTKIRDLLIKMEKYDPCIHQK